MNHNKILETLDMVKERHNNTDAYFEELEWLVEFLKEEINLKEGK
tara:strand:+ start:249 stop:383 length:135 start_codon:yes stop_codon:yes gene_type:complete